jgi:two-component system OmpR family response regulator
MLAVDFDLSRQRQVGESVAHTGGEGIKTAVEGNHELVVLDVMLPDKKGFEAQREIRMRVRTPVLMLTAKGGRV